MKKIVLVMALALSVMMAGAQEMFDKSSIVDDQDIGLFIVKPTGEKIQVDLVFHTKIKTKKSTLTKLSNVAGVAGALAPGMGAFAGVGHAFSASEALSGVSRVSGLFGEDVLCLEYKGATSDYVVAPGDKLLFVMPVEGREYEESPKFFKLIQVLNSHATTDDFAVCEFGVGKKARELKDSSYSRFKGREYGVDTSDKLSFAVEQIAPNAYLCSFETMAAGEYCVVNTMYPHAAYLGVFAFTIE